MRHWGTGRSFDITALCEEQHLDNAEKEGKLALGSLSLVCWPVLNVHATVSGVLVMRSQIVRQLEELGLRLGGTTMVHCRMSSLGWVVGGAETVVRALLDTVGAEGTLVAYTGWQDAPPDDLDILDESAKRAYLDEHPAYDPRIALSSRDHGRIPEVLRTCPGSLHSGHPEAGVAAVGPLAGAITASHPHDDAYGPGTPYARLVALGGRILTLGAPLETITLVHHAEAVANVPGKRRVSYGMPVLVDGRRVWRTFSDIDTGRGALPYERLLGGEDYIEHIARSALASGIGSSGLIGETTAHLFEARELLEHAVDWIEQNFSTESPPGSEWSKIVLSELERRDTSPHPYSSPKLLVNPRGDDP